MLFSYVAGGVELTVHKEGVAVEETKEVETEFSSCAIYS